MAEWWHYLLGVPFAPRGEDPKTGLDCYGQALVVNAHRDVKLPDIGDHSNLDAVTSTLRRMPDDTVPQVGDLLLSDPTGLGYPSHVATVVAPGVAISTSVRNGAYAWPIRRVRRECGIWRVIETSRS